jgi:hypothetical protein
MSIIEVDGLAKTFRSRERPAGVAGSLGSFIAPRYREREAVKHISFTLEPGEILAFIGIVQGFVQEWAISPGRVYHVCHASSTTSLLSSPSSRTCSGSKDTW